MNITIYTCESFNRRDLQTRLFCLFCMGMDKIGSIDNVCFYLSDDGLNIYDCLTNKARAYGPAYGGFGPLKMN